MKILYFDLINGISGDMILGALFDAGLDYVSWKEEVEKLNLSGFEIEISKKEKNGIIGSDFKLNIFDTETERKGVDLIKIVEKSKLSDDVKEKSIEILKRIIEVEAKIHNEKFEEVHLHELSGLDTIIDIVGSVVGLKLLEIKKIYSSQIPLGSGFINSKHGLMPVPAPATVELLKGVPVYSNGVKGEITTPTGAAILSTLVNSYGYFPPIKIEKIGYGLGKKDFEIPNVLRVLIGELYEDYLKDFNILIETNIDDMNPQIMGYLVDKALSLGALDIFFTPIYMKKNRPAYKVSILCEEKDKKDLMNLIFEETTSIGVRVTRVEKVFLKREIKELETKLGKIRVKITYFKGDKKVSPEFEDIKKISEEKNLPISKVYSFINKEINKTILEG